MSRAVQRACRFLLVTLGCALLHAEIAAAQTREAEQPNAGDASELTRYLPWRDTALLFDQSLGANTFSKNAQLSYDPYYAVGLDLWLYWHFSEHTRLRIEQGIEIELTSSDTTTWRQKPLLSDTDLRLEQLLWSSQLATHRKLDLSGGVEAVVPVSLASRAAGLMLGAGPRIGAALSFEDWLRGIQFRAIFGYIRRFSRGNAVSADVPYPCFGGTAGTGTSASCSYLGSLANPRDILQANLIAQGQLSEKWSALIWLAFEYWHAYALAPAQIMTDTGAVVTLADASPTHWRNTRSIRVAVAYSLGPVLDLMLSVTNAFSERSPNGNLRAPFRPVDTIFGLTAALLLDQAYVAARGAHTTDEGKP